MGALFGLIKKAVGIFSVKKQQEAVGGRRVWVFCLAVAFVLAAHFLGIPDGIVYATVSAGGAFIVGESAHDVANVHK